MKKMFLSFAEQMLSKEQMKKVKGGCGTCTVRCYDHSEELLGSIELGSSCTGGRDECANKYKEKFDSATCSCA